ncbi:MAG: alginate export family protein [Elusimicrobiota bacterium]|nr:alginate export family protein [Elusimicrobiota bacterium]
MIALSTLFLFVASSAAAAIEPPKLTFGGQVRARAETTNIESYATPLKRRGYDLTTLRTRLGVAVETGHKVNGFIQLQDSRSWGSETTVATNMNLVDLHQGYVDVLDLFSQPLDLRVGRMEMQYGDQRLISPLDWSNVGRAWDGARLRWRGSNYSVDLFDAVVKEVNIAKRNGHFWGLYASCKAVPKHEFDAYILGRDQRDGTVPNERATSNGNLSDRTVGARIKGTPGRFDYTGEADWQFGRKAGQQVRAWALAATGGYTLDLAYKPRLGAEYTFASGDSNSADGKVQTFDPLYAFIHAYQGYQDIFAWKNGHDFKGSVSVDPKPGWRAQADFHHFRLHRAFDAWYDATGAAIIARSATGAPGKDIGNELDLHVRGKFREVITLWFGWSRFFAGSYVKATTTRGDRDWGFFQAAFNF